MAIIAEMLVKKETNYRQNSNVVIKKNCLNKNVWTTAVLTDTELQKNSEVDKKWWRWRQLRENENSNKKVTFHNGNPIDVKQNVYFLLS